MDFPEGPKARSAPLETLSEDAFPKEPPKESDCVKSPMRCHPRERGDPYHANIDWIPTFPLGMPSARGNDNNGSISFHTV